MFSISCKGNNPNPWLLIHGFMGQDQSWNPLLKILPEGQSACTLNLPGHHPRAPVDDRLPFEAVIDQIAEALKSQKHPPTRLMGYSMGARIGLGLLIQHPNLFERALLIGVNPGLEEKSERTKRIEQEAQWAWQLEHQGMEAFVNTWERLPLFKSQRNLSPEIRKTQRSLRLAHDPKALAQVVRRLGLGAMPNYWPKLIHISVRIDFVAGEYDPKFKDIAQRASKLAPKACTKIIPGAGHNVLLETPKALANLM